MSRWPCSEKCWPLNIVRSKKFICWLEISWENNGTSRFHLGSHLVVEKECPDGKDITEPNTGNGMVVPCSSREEFWKPCIDLQMLVRILYPLLWVRVGAGAL